MSISAFGIAGNRLATWLPHKMVNRLCVYMSSMNTAEPSTSTTPDKLKLLENFPVNNVQLRQFISQQYELCQPDDIYICDGTQAEYKQLCHQLVKSGVMHPLDPIKRPNSFLTRTDPNDVARSESSTFICSNDKSDAGPTNNWMAPKDMRARLNKLFHGTMRGRTMYVIPFSMGPIGSPLSRIGVQITDSPFVVANMHLMTRVGKPVLDILGSTNQEFVPCTHSVGSPLQPNQPDTAWPCNTSNRHIVHFPESREIWSFGSGYGGNSLLGKKCFALRIASCIARDEGWLAEHMLILGVTSPTGKKHYIAAAFPSACGKTNLAMMNPTLPGWKIECVGDDIAWMQIRDGKLYAINPESGFFGVAPGTCHKTNPNAMKAMEKNAIFTNVALTDTNDVYWEGLDNKPTGSIQDWQGKWRPSEDKSTTFAHPNARFTVRAEQCPTIDSSWQSPKGVPISAILFGGRRATTVPLVYQSFNWQHGTFIGSTVASEKTAAAEGQLGELRFDPMAMLPFCGYHMGDYFQHWLKLGESTKMPPIFHVNWFRQKNGKFLWPGFGENCRVLKWIVERIEGGGKSRKTPIGFVPTVDAIDQTGLALNESQLKEALNVDSKAFLKEVEGIKKFHAQFGDKLPLALKEETIQLEQRLLSDIQGGTN